jgi:hypothetical protein
MRLLRRLVLSAMLPLSISLTAQTVPSGFQDTTVLTGLVSPTVVRFAPDGRVFVAQKDGQIFVYESLTGARSLYADLRVPVHNFWDRGLLGMVLDPNFTKGRPYVYVLYTYDRLPDWLSDASIYPRWNDACPTPPGATTDGCVVTARLSRL